MLKRIVALLFLIVLCLWGEHRIIRMVPFGDNNLKIVFDKPITDLQWQTKHLKDANKKFIDFEANLTIPKRNFIFKDNSTLQVAQNTPKIVRVVISPHAHSTYEIVKEKENLYIQFKPKTQIQKPLVAEPSSTPPESVKKTFENLETESTKNTPQTNKTAARTGTGKKIVIDPGHGGKDCGTKSVEDKCEKIIVLDAAKLVVQELKNRGYNVYMTRNTDVYIDLRKRTEFANAKNADLFISIHANSMPKDSPKTPSGVETYFLSPARSERAEQVAKAENQGDMETMSHFATKSFLNTISSFHLVASHKLAIDIQSGILNAVRPQYDTHDGAVREGPFWVLAGALMPSVLIEIGYASHKDEGKLISKKEYQKLLAKGIADGIDGYFIRNY